MTLFNNIFFPNYQQNYNFAKINLEAFLQIDAVFSENF